MKQTTQDVTCRDCCAVIEQGTEIHTDDLGDYILCRCGASQDHDPDGFREEN